ncbi:peptidase M28, partial [Bacillus sp. D-CC]
FHSHHGVTLPHENENAVKLIVEVIKRLDKEAVHNITFN